MSWIPYLIPSYSPNITPTTTPTFPPGTSSPTPLPTPLTTTTPTASPTSPTPSPTDEVNVEFYGMGDTPYSNNDSRKLKTQLLEDVLIFTTFPTTTPRTSSPTSPTPSPTLSPTDESPTPLPTPLPTATPTASPTSSTPSPTNEVTVEFYVMGDTPYSDSDARKLKRQLEDIPRRVPFIYHVGDITKARDSRCRESEYSRVRDILLEARSPVFITPGDNDWNDCPNPNRAWDHWSSHFMSFDRHWNHELDVRRQSGRNENIPFFMDFVLFVGVNIVGGSRNSRSEWKSRHDDNFNWVVQNIKRHIDYLGAVVIFGHAKPSGYHDDFFDPLAGLAERLDNIPFLYIHGDGHSYYVKKKAFDTDNVWDVQVDMGGRAPPLKVTVTKGATRKPFDFDRRR